MLDQLQKELRAFVHPEKAKILSRFFKTGKGEYGEGDTFLGIVVPIQRMLVKKYWKEISLNDLNHLITSAFHEERLVALLIAVVQFEKGNEKERKKIFDFYLKHTNYINNWDLVDLSAPNIIGSYLQNKDKSVLVTLGKSRSLWERRIAMLSTFHYIKQSDPIETLRIATLLVHDDHDLIHKAVGWMLREVGKRCGEEVEEQFLQQHYKIMPRTTLRYAIERFPEKKRKIYLGRIRK